MAAETTALRLLTQFLAVNTVFASAVVGVVKNPHMFQTMGCRSYVNGYNLSNSCTTGGCGGYMCNGDAWGPRHSQVCANCNICGIFGADFGMMGTTGQYNGFGGCHCRGGDWSTLDKHHARNDANCCCN